MLPALIATALIVAPASAPAERRLYPAELSSSSFLWTDWNAFQENYHPNYIGDDDPKTAWVEGAKGTGVGEWIRIKVTAMEGATKARLSIRNGYQKSDKLFKANGRPEKILVTLLPSKTAKEVTLADKEGFQDVVIEQPAGALDTVEIKLLSVYPGTKYEDTCISDVDVYVTATTRENPAYEKTLFEKLQAWRKDRLDAAKLFASNSKAQVPVAAGYSVTSRDVEYPDITCSNAASYQTCSITQHIPFLAGQLGGKHARAVAMADSIMKSHLEGFTPVQAVPKDKRRTPAVDNTIMMGFDDEPFDNVGQLLIPEELGFLRTSTIGVFDTKDEVKPEDVARADIKPCQSKTPKRFAWAKMVKSDNGPDRLKALMVGTCGLVCSRDGLSPSGNLSLYVYDDNGNLEILAETYGAEAYDWSEDGKRIVGGTSYWGTAKANDSVATK